MIEIKDKIEKLCVNESGRSTASTLAATILDNIRTLNQKIHKRFFGIVALCLLFELLDRSTSNSITFLGIEFNDSDLTQRLIVPILAYLLFLSIVLIVHRRILEGIYGQVNRSLYGESGFDGLQTCQLYPNIISSYNIIAIEFPGRTTSTLRAISKFGFAFIGLAALVFMIYAIVRLIYKFGLFDPLVLLSILSCVFSVIQSYVLMAAVVQQVDKSSERSASGGGKANSVAVDKSEQISNVEHS